MSELAKLLILIGAIMLVSGLVMLGIQKLPFSDRIPGDIIVKKENVTLYFPLGTGIILSVLVSLILYLINKIR